MVSGIESGPFLLSSGVDSGSLVVYLYM